MRKLLIVSPHFPPVNAPDMQRVRMSLPHYPSCGWDPVVLTVGEAWQEGPLEPPLAGTLPPGLRIVRARAWPIRWTRLFGLHHLGLRAWLSLFRTGSRLLRTERFDAVFFSTTQFVVFALGPLWRRRHGVPYIIDIQDPWRTDYYERPGSRRAPGGWKYAFARAQARLLEGWCYRGASAVMSVSPQYLEAMRARHPGTGCTPAAVIRFGASRTDLRHAAALSPARQFPRSGGERHLLYTGAAGPVMPHALLVLFEALRRYRDQAPERAARLKFHFIGTSYVTPGREKPSVTPVARACGVGDQVEEIAHRVGFLESLQLQRAADALMLMGSSDLAYSPSKVFHYYLSGRPILALVFRDSVMEGLLEELSCAWIIRFREHEPKEEAYAGLARFFDSVLDGFAPGSLPNRYPAHFEANYLAAELTRRQCLLFDEAIGAPIS